MTGITCALRGLGRFAAVLTILTFSVRASTIDITVTGVVLSATDTSGVFGPPNTNLTGHPYQLVFDFNDTSGNQTAATCDGTPYAIRIESTPSSNPGTATLSIGGNSFTFGVLNASYQADSIPKRRRMTRPVTIVRSILRRATAISETAAE